MRSESLLSRCAENHFWLARYVERAENLARILDVNETFARKSDGVQDWLPIVQLQADEDVFFDKHDEATAKAVVHFYVADQDNPNSIRRTIWAARENARALRHLISIELWTQLNIFDDWLKNLKRRDYDLANLSGLCGQIKERCQLHTGIVKGTMVRDQASLFYELGKQLERADQLTRLVDIKYHRLLPSPDDVGSPIDVSQWNAVLRSAAAYQAYRRFQPSGMTPNMVAGFLLFNPSFPRSFRTCIREMKRRIEQLTNEPALAEIEPPVAALRPLEQQAATTIDKAVDQGLHEFLDQAQLNLIGFGQALAETYFDQAA